MPLDDLDRKLLQAVAKGSLVPATKLGEMSQRAEAEGRPLSRILVEEFGPDPTPVLGLLRNLHAGFAAHDEDALDRHEDRLIARLALKVKLLDEAAARAAVTEQESRRAAGAHARLGEILVEQGRIDPATAERLYRQFENAAVVCHDCFAPNQRNRIAAGATLECPRCGAQTVVPPPAEKPGWTQAAPGDGGLANTLATVRFDPIDVVKPPPQPELEPTSDVVYAQAGSVLKEAERGDDQEPVQTPSSRTKRIAPQKRRRPKLEPEDRRKSRIRAVLAIVGVVGILAGVIVAWRLMSPSEGQFRFQRFKELVKVANENRAGGSIEEAARYYDLALEQFKDVTPPPDAVSLVSDVKNIDQVCADFSARTAKMNNDGDATPLCEMAKTCKDHAVLSEMVKRLVASKDSEAVAGLVTLSDSEDDEIARSACQAALVKSGPRAVPLIEKILDKEGSPLQQSAVISLLKITDKSVIPVMTKALDRFPKQDGLWLNAAQLLSTIKDPAAIPLLKKLAHDERAQVSEAAIFGLTKIAPQEATAELVAGLDGSDTVQASSLAALRKLGEKAVAPLSAALAKGQATAALPLIEIASRDAIGAIVDTLPKLPWDKRGSVLEALCSGTAPTGWLSATVGKIVNEAREALLKKDAKLTRTVLAQVVTAAKAFGFPDAANELKFELRFIELADRSPQVIEDRNLETIEADDSSSEPRLELRNFTEARLVLYARGPERVELHAVSNTESGRVIAPGKYDVWIARVADDGREVDPAHGSLSLEPGKVTSIQYGTRPDAEEEARSVARGKRSAEEAQAGPDESEGDKLKRIFDRGFRLEQLEEEARKTLAQRLKDESPWSSGAETVEKTSHYKVMTDTGADRAKKVGAELEKAFDAYAKILSAPADVGSAGFVVRFFKQKSDYDKWRNRTSHFAILMDAISKDRKISDRMRQLAQRGRAADSQLADQLVQVADALDKGQGIEEVEIDLEELDDELNRSEKAKDPRLLLRAMARAFQAVQGTVILAAASGRSPHGIILGHYNHVSHELCLFEVEGWERTLRHEAFHQFLFAHAAKAPSWIHEGMATYFEALDKKGKNEERIAELRRENESSALLDNLKLASLLNTERLDSLDYAISWSFIYYLIEKEPDVLGRILARAREGKASTFGVVSAFDDMLRTESEWQKSTRKLVLGN